MVSFFAGSDNLFCYNRRRFLLEPARASDGHTARYNTSTTTGAAAGATGDAARAGTGDKDGRRGRGPAATRKTGEGGDRRPPERTGGAAARSPERDVRIGTNVLREEEESWGDLFFFLAWIQRPRGLNRTPLAGPAETFGRRTGAYKRPYDNQMMV